MFQYNLKQILISQNQLNVKYVGKKELNNQVETLLLEFEQNVLDNLKTVYDFKYVQSTVGGNKLFNIIKKRLSNKIHVEMITQHPSYTSGILINDLIPLSLKGHEVFALFFTGDFGKCWLNSQTKSENLIIEINKLLKISNFIGDFKITIIEIFDSDKLNFKESQKGATQKRWKLM